MSDTLKALFISLIFHISIVTTLMYANFETSTKKEIVLNLSMMQEVKKVKEVIEQKEVKNIQKEIKPTQELKKEPTKQKPKEVKKIVLKPKITPKPIEKKITKKEEHKVALKQSPVVKEIPKEIIQNNTIAPPQKVVQKLTEKPQLNYQKEYLNVNLSDIIKAIKKHTIYPYKAKKRGIEGRVILSCKFCKSGELKEIEIIQSSNFKLLDENSIEILKVASKEFSKPKEDIELTIPFNYYLE